MRMTRWHPFGAFFCMAAFFVTSVVFLPRPVNAATVLTVNAAQRYQAVQALGVNANVHSWNNGQLAPALDQLIDEMGANAFRVVIENADWEATNDDQDPAHFNWDYYNTVYESPKLTDLWNTIAYLNSKGATVSLNVMGHLPDWMGGSSLSVSEEDEWVEMMASLAYYGRVVKHLSFTLFEPFNESDLIPGIEGALASADQVARVMHQLGVRLDALGLQDVKFILPDTASTTEGLNSYFPAMLNDSYLMEKVVALGLHSYFGETGNANSVIKASAYPGLPFWMTEFSAVCDGCNTGAPNPADWPYARTTADYLMGHLRDYAAGAEVWEGYDSYYEHHASWSYWGLLGYDQASGTYNPRKNFYAMAQFMRFIPAGSVRIGASAGSGNVSLLAFHDPASGRVTVVGLNTSSSAETLSGTITGISGLSTMAYYRTNANANMEAMGDVAVSNGAFSATVAGDTLFTLTGVAGPDVTAPTVALTSPVSGATVAGVMPLAATANDDRGVARVEFTVDGTVVGSDAQAPFQVSWDARTVAVGPHTISARAVDGAGNNASSSADVTVITDTTPPSTPEALTASAPSSSQVTLSWQPSTDNIAVAGYVVLRDGAVIGSATTTSYTDTTLLAGHTYSYAVQARDTSDNLSAPSAPVTVTVGTQPVLTVDKTVTTHQTTAAATISSPVFSTTSPDELLVAFAASDGPSGSTQAFSAVTGGGLTWRLRQRANAQAGTAEIWTAAAPSVLTNAQVTATRSNGSWMGSLVVVAFSGADTATSGAAAGASAASGAPTVRLTTTGAGSWVWGVGDDWDRAIARTVPAGQTLVDQFLASVGDTFWVQRLDSTTPSAGTTVTINDTAPTTDRWNLAAIEILPSAAPAPDTTAPTVSITTPADGATVAGSTSVTAAASDNVGVASVEFYVDDTLAATDSTSPYSFAWDTASAADGQHVLKAKAYDAAGNSATSAAVRVTVGNADTAPPTAPTGLSATATGPTAVHLTWAASTDNVGVTGYAVIRDGQQVGTTAAASYSDTTVQAATTYTYVVTARDAGGNVSAPSSSATVTTPAADTTPPTVAVTAPTEGATVSGVVTVTASADDDVGVAKVEFSVDEAVASTDTNAPYSFAWDSTAIADGQHVLKAKAYDAAGNSATSAAVTVTVRNAIPLSIDVWVATHQTRASGSITSPVFSTTRTGDLLVAFAASDGPSKQAQTFRTVTGAGLTWQLRQRANGQRGTVEIWTAAAPSELTDVRVTATRARGSYQGSLVVVAFSGADTVTSGAAAGASAASGAPTVTLTTTGAGSWVWGVGHDSSRATARTVPDGQTVFDQFLASAGDTYWVQRLDSTTPSAGTTVTINDTAPTTDRWNLAAIEIRSR